MPRKILVMLWQPDVEQTARLSLQQKLHALGQVLNVAYAHFQDYCNLSAHKETTLLFVGPEHFFVDKDCSAYSEEQKQKIQAQLELQSRSLPHCILLPGTLKWRQLVPVNSPAHQDAIKGFKTVGFQNYKNLHQDPFPFWQYTISAQDRQFIFNTSLIIHQGTSYEYSKRTASNDLTDVENQEAAFRFGTQSAFLELEGLRLGFEICSDHDHRLLRKQIETDQGDVDIHIVQSKGLPSLVDAMACHPNGIYVHCDYFASYNSLVLAFHQGIGQESRSLGRQPDHGLIWWDVSLEPISLNKQLTKSFVALTISTLRKEARIIEPECSQRTIKRI